MKAKQKWNEGKLDYRKKTNGMLTILTDYLKRGQW
jgi:hypothetical protein